ncbi:hypothetical protein F7230_03740 [Corynebacterium sp. 320]|uniref:hypothetical protein n=1 Tax=Corynebacterium TaxID=1716 RepID=UPI00125CC72B|nr:MULTISPECIES: hypothetical protein [Corynebacterium]KAB1504208.1 hypothetical protein F7230_03740 [Corynebacterium sp. 320]KAB1552692.1 hypothetical protein F7233_02850 [Corynebacterium sp. 321]KAB1554090.1 hypothetical protein F7232_03735 [Corynebacterium sp. 319]KAB3528344.1 hypothetical protein F8354_03740 [Corynebacterium sp. 250]KAB3540167.1 hypothetical protein F8390_02595 [Corynebacterium sp. 366]
MSEFSIDQSVVDSAAARAEQVAEALRSSTRPHAEVVAIPQASRFVTALTRAYERHHAALRDLGEHYSAAAQGLRSLSAATSVHDVTHATALAALG